MEPVVRARVPADVTEHGRLRVVDPRCTAPDGGAA